MNEDLDDEEDWYDDDGALDEGDTAPCPECGAPVHLVTDKCPACGCWLSEADRRATVPGMVKPLWLRVTADLVLLALLLSALGVAVAIF